MSSSPITTAWRAATFRARTSAQPKRVNTRLSLSLRGYTAAWNVPITAMTEKFHEDMLTEDWGPGIRSRRYDVLNLLIGCVDNAKARKSLHQALRHNLEFMDYPTWWLDCGNSDESGQVLLGSAPTIEHMKKAFPSEKVCKRLPSPALQAPELLMEKPEERSSTRLSCAELMALNAQSLMVNQQAASIAANYLARLTTGKALRYFATYFDQESGITQSKYATPGEVARVIGKSARYVMEIKTMTTTEFRDGVRPDI
jgi:hypothetical protein